MVVQWLRFGAPNWGSLDSIPGGGIRSHVLQLRVHIPQWRPGTTKYIYTHAHIYILHTDIYPTQFCNICIHIYIYTHIYISRYTCVCIHIYIYIYMYTHTLHSVRSLGPGVHKVLFEPSKHLWQVWHLILNVISPLLPSCWGFSFALGCAVSLFSGIQHSPVGGCSAASCNYGVLKGENECTSFYSGVLKRFCIGTWNVRSMNQGKLEVVKQDMARHFRNQWTQMDWNGQI